MDRNSPGESKSTWDWRLHAMSLSERRLAYPDTDGDSTTAIICAKFRKHAFPWGGKRSVVALLGGCEYVSFWRGSSP